MNSPGETGLAHQPSTDTELMVFTVARLSTEFQLKKIVKTQPRDRPGHVLIFRPWIIHPVTKKIVYPRRGKVFPIWVKIDGDQLPLPGVN